MQPESVKKTSNIYGQVYKFAKEPITTLQQMYPGDHVAYERVKLYWHHVLVEDIDDENQEVHVIHYYNDLRGFFETAINQGSLAKVKRDSLKFWPKRFYRIIYHRDVNSPERVLELARSRIGEACYSPMRLNCEHFCTECKIGEAVSIQVEVLVENVLATILPTLSRVMLEQLLEKSIETCIKELSKDFIKTYGKTVLVKLTQVVFEVAMMHCVGFIGSRTAWLVLRQNTASVVKVVFLAQVEKIVQRAASKEMVKKAARSISGKTFRGNSQIARCTITKSGVLATFAVEVAFAGKDIKNASQKKEAGEITKKEFQETVIKRVVGATVSAPMSLAGSVIGQYLLPIPVVGSLVGGISGSAAGRVVGAVVSTTVIKTRKHVGNFMKSFSWRR